MLEPKMENVTNKETLNLLDLLSETESDVSDLVFTPQRKKKIKRRYRPSNTVKMKHSNNFCGCKRSQMKVTSLWIAAVLITLWLMALSWLAVILYGEIGKVDISMKSIIAGSEGLPDAIQKCDSTSKQLQRNQSILFTQVSNLKTQISNLTEQITAIQRGLQEVQNSLQAEPQLTSLPKDFKNLQNSVAKVGGEISDLKPTVDALKDANKNLLSMQNIMQQNISSLQTSLQEKLNITQKPQFQSTNETNVKIEDLKSTVSQLAKNLSIINQNITARLNWGRDEQAKDHSNLDKLQDKAENLRTEVETLRDDSVTIHKQINKIQSEYNNTLVELKETCNALQESQTSVLALENKSATSALNNSAVNTLTEKSGIKEISTATDQNIPANQNMMMKQNM